MVFYFSATGNSKFVADRVQERFGGHTCDMAKAFNKGMTDFTFEEGEKAVFVFPVYYAGLPSIVSNFIASMNFIGPDPEITGIFTYGSLAFGADKQFKKAIQAKGKKVRAVYDVKMVENCIFMFNIPIREAALMTLKRANDRIRDVLDSMEYNHRVTFKSNLFAGAISGLEQSLYKSSCGTQKFWVSDKCIGCGLCQTICPAKAIDMDEGRPVWVKDKCVHCAGCIMRCPAEAIQYGKSTEKRNRYVNPDLK